MIDFWISFGHGFLDTSIIITFFFVIETWNKLDNIEAKLETLQLTTDNNHDRLVHLDKKSDEHV